MHAGHSLPCRVEKSHPLDLDSCFTQLRRNVHALDHVDRSASHVDRAAAGTKGATALYDSDLMAVPGQPESKGASSYSRARDQNLKPWHHNSRFRAGETTPDGSTDIRPFAEECLRRWRSRARPAAVPQG